MISRSPGSSWRSRVERLRSGRTTAVIAITAAVAQTVRAPKAVASGPAAELADRDRRVGQQIVDRGDARELVGRDVLLQGGVPGDGRRGQPGAADDGDGRQPRLCSGLDRDRADGADDSTAAASVTRSWCRTTHRYIKALMTRSPTARALCTRPHVGGPLSDGPRICHGPVDTRLTKKKAADTGHSQLHRAEVGPAVVDVAGGTSFLICR